jgi:hypothetical protein
MDNGSRDGRCKLSLCSQRGNSPFHLEAASMLYWLFLSCTIAGGTILICQFILTMLGFAHLGGDHDFGGDLHHDGPAIDHIDVDHGDGAPTHEQHFDANWLFAMLSLRTVTAGAAFFGLGGLGAASLEWPVFLQLLVATACGFAALCGVYYLLKSMMMLNTDNTVRINRAIGQRGVVYLTVPAQSAGQGKVQVTLANRQMEYPAITKWANALKSGEPITVVSVLNNSTLEVAPLVGEK